MAAYAALVSLTNNVQQIMNHPQLSTSLDRKQMESVEERVGFLLHFVENYNSHGGISKEAEDLESQIACAAHVAEDIIESHIVDQIHAGSTEKNPSSVIDLHKIVEGMDTIREKVMKLGEKTGLKDHELEYPALHAASGDLIPLERTMVGFDGYFNHLMDVLTAYQSHRQIFPIVGMGGIGKTTLARNVYEKLHTTQYFDRCAWVTVSQQYSVREILLEALSCLGKSRSQLNEKTEDHELGEKLHKILFGRRYLIVLDDMWNIGAWDKISYFFPENGNGSRIVVTTRQSGVANKFGTLGLALKLLDEDKSWELFCEKAFADEDCPDELEKIGKTIVRKCRGLPLAIVVIGGILLKSSRKPEYWENVAKDISSVLNSEDVQCLDILTLSYHHLPACLKPCFLYLGIFPEDYEIRVSRVIKLWVAEGFLKPNEGKTLEEIAEGYINDLYDRNLILVSGLRSNGKLKSFKIHDLLRDLCLRVGEKENFICARKTVRARKYLDGQSRIMVVQNDAGEKYAEYSLTSRSESFARSLICDKGTMFWFESRFFRVLIEVYKGSLENVFKQVNLRFLAYEFLPHWAFFPGKLPSSISLPWNLQTLIIGKRVDAPSEIWEMSQLRHLHIDLIRLPDPPPSVGRDFSALLNLQTLETVQNFRCSEEVLRRIPNIKKLGICYDLWGESEIRFCLYNLDCLNKLESLNCGFDEWRSRNDLIDKFPSSLKKLTLTGGQLHWQNLTVVGSLPNLEVLKLGDNAFIGDEWNPVEGEFVRLKFLGIYMSNDLIYWNAESSHFPILEKLVLRHVTNLNAIPSSLGDIPTLASICVEYCSVSATISAVKLVVEQENLGNDSLRLRVQIWDPRDREEFKETLIEEGFDDCLQSFWRNC